MRFHAIQSSPRPLPLLNMLVDSRGSHSTSKLGQMVAVLFLGLVAAATLHAQSSTRVSVSPAAGSGAEQAFVATYTDPNGVTDVQAVSLFIMNGVAPDSDSGWSAHQCILNYKISSGVIQLAQDAGGAFLSTTATAGTAQTVSNSQCTVLATLSSSTISGNSVSVIFYLTFTAAFSGAKQLYLSAEDQDGHTMTNFPTQVGIYNVTASVSPVSVFPSSGSGSEQTFTATYSDATTQIKSVFLNFKSSSNNTSAANACKLRYDLGTTDIFLVNDAGTAYTTPIISGSIAPLSNSQCTVYGVGTSATTSANSVTVDFRVRFAAGFAGEKEITMEGVDENGTFTFSNLSFGTYTVTTQSPTAAPNFTLSNTAVSIASPGATGISTITVTPTGGFSGTVAFSCAVTDSPSGAVDLPTCLPAAPAAISGAAAVTASLAINTKAASAAMLHNPLEQIFTLSGGMGMAALLFFGLPTHRRRWKTLLCLLLITEFAGAAIGCGGTAYPVAAPVNPGTADPGTTVGRYTVKVTGTSGATIASTAVTVMVN